MHSAAARATPVPKKEWPGLAATLTAFDDDALARLLALRPDLARPAPGDMVALASRAGAWPSARDCFYTLDRAAQQVVEALCLLDQPTTADLASLLGLPADDADLAGALDRLAERALAFTSGDQPGTVRLLPALRQFDYPARLGPPLAVAKGGPSEPGLDQVAVRLGLKPARAKAATLGAVATVLSDPAAVERLLEQAPPGAAALARRVAAEGPLVRVEGGVYRVDDRSPAGWLLNRRLLAIVDYFTAVMPREPALALRGGRAFPAGCLRRPEVATAAVDAGEVDRAAAERALHAVADVTALVDLWDAEPPALLKSGGIGVREVHKLAKAMGRSDAGAARIVDLAALSGLVATDYMAGLALPTAAADEWTGLGAPARWAQLARAWLAADLHLSLAGAIGPKDKPIPPLLEHPPGGRAVRRRRLVLAVLAEAAEGTALDPEGVRERVEWESPGTWAGGPARAAELISWVLEEAELLGVAAAGALSSAGRALLAGQAEAATAELARLAPPTVTDFVVQADLTAMVAGEPAAAVRAELELMADVESKGAATVYRFGEASLRRAFDAGRTAADILGFLERHARHGVPQPLAYLVADLGRRYGNVRVGAATSYVRSDDPSLLAEVLQARRTARLHFRRLAPTVLVTEADPAAVITTLQAAGYLPAQEAPDGSLVLARPPARRAPARRRPSPHSAGPPDIAAAVAELRHRPGAGAGGAKSRAPAVAPAPLPGRPSPLLTPRPPDIAKGGAAIRALLDQACDEYWPVRLSYVNSQGGSTDLTVEPTDIDEDRLYADCLPSGNERAFSLERIEWARVLTEAEEDLLG